MCERRKKSGFFFFFLEEMILGKSIRLAHREDILGSANSLSKGVKVGKGKA